MGDTTLTAVIDREVASPSAITLPLRAGVIGCGAGAAHMDAYANDARSNLVALAGLDTDRCRQLAQRHNIPSVYRDYQDLLADPDIDVVSVAVPNNLHMPVAVAALEAGKHVLVEKPLALNAEEGQIMVETAKRTGKRLAIAFNRRYRHDVQLVAGQVADGTFGRVYYTKAFWMRRSGIPGMGTWFTRKDMAGGGPLIDLGVHVLDMALFTMGNPKVVSVSAATFAELGPQGQGQWPAGRFRTGGQGVDYEVEDMAVAFIRLDTGAVIQMETSWAAYTGAYDTFGVELMGSHGGAKIHVEDYALVDTLSVYGDFAGQPAVIRPQLNALNGHGEVIRDFLTSIIEDVDRAPTGEQGLALTRLVDAIYRAADEGREITIDPATR